MIEIDGSRGEGGGQIIRSALGLSLVTGKAFQIKNIRAGRKKPGLLRQHLTAVRAAAEIGSARVEGDNMGSKTLRFEPGSVKGGHYHYAVGTAGSANLVLQAVLPGLLQADEPSELILEGGTHNQASPPFDFLKNTFAPVLHRMGPKLSLTLDRHGFYPAGGGCMTVQIEPAPLKPIELNERGALQSIEAHAVIARLAKHIADRELNTVGERLEIPHEHRHIRFAGESQGPGNVLLVTLTGEHVTETICGFGDRGMRAEDLAEAVAAEAQAYLNADVPVGAHLADQLLIPFAMAGGGSFRTTAPSSHFTTNVETVRTFLDVSFRVEHLSEKAWAVTVR
ncbi:MAG: RNA 3'-terminal phosphate cyclase [Acidobacteriota bacterium]|nr:RNA 3'-terminal phosphate cyclase [Acidobacteriota bacterium]